MNINKIQNNLAAGLAALALACLPGRAPAQTLTAPLTLTGAYNSSFVDSGSSFGPSVTFKGSFWFVSWDDTLALQFTPVADVSGNSLTINCPGSVDLNLANCGNSDSIQFAPSGTGTVQMDPSIQLGLKIALLWNGSGPSGTLKDPTSYSFPDGPLGFACYGFTPATLTDEQTQTLYSENVLGDVGDAFGIDIPDWLASIDLNVNANITASETVSCLGISSTAGKAVTCEQPLSVTLTNCNYSLCNIAADWNDKFVVDEGLGLSVDVSLLFGIFSWSDTIANTGPLVNETTVLNVSSAPVNCVNFTLPQYQVTVQQATGGVISPESLYHKNCSPTPASPVLWLPFDETSGAVSANLASPANYGTQVNNPTPDIGAYVDNSLDFDGVNQYVTVPDYPGIEIGTNDFTLALWVNRATNGPNSLPSVLVDKRDVNSGVGYGLSLSYGALIMTLSGNNYIDTGTRIVQPDGKWHFVGVSVSQSTGKMLFYIDGISNSTAIFTPGNLANTDAFWTGASPLGGNRPWTGDLDEVQVYNTALTTNQLAGIFLAGTAGNCKTTATETVCEGQCLEFTATPDPGYYLCGWFVNGVRQKIGNAYWLGSTFTLSGVQANDTVTAEFCQPICLTCYYNITNTTAAVGIDVSSAILSGTFSAAGYPGLAYYEFGPLSGYTTTTPPVAFGAVAGDIAITNVVTGLLPNTSYQYALVVSNANGVAVGTVQTFTTTATPPAVTTAAFTLVSATSVLLQGSVNPEGAPSSAFFNWGITTNYRLTYANSDQSFLADTAPDPVTELLTNLQPGVTYHYQLVAMNATGATLSPDQVFTVPGAAPALSAITNLATSDLATITGLVNPNGLDTSLSVNWGTNLNYGSSTPVQSFGDAATNLTFAVGQLSPLRPAQTYHYQVVAANAAGSTTTTDYVFTTAPAAPAVLFNPVFTTGGLQLLLTGTYGQAYAIQSTPSLTPPVVWTTLTNLTLTTNVESYLDAGALHQPARFYRAVIPASP